MDHFSRTSTPFDIRWMRDGIHLAPAPGYFVVTEVDMTSLLRFMNQQRQQTSASISPTHIMVSCVARVASKDIAYRELLTDSERLQFPHVAIGVSMDAGTIVAPVYVIEESETKTVEAIALELQQAKPQVLKKNASLWMMAKRWGWLIPFSSWRQWILRQFIHRAEIIYRTVGNIQLSCLKDVDVFIPLQFSTPIIVSMGAIKKRPIVVDEQIKVCETAFISICANHKNWEGQKASRFLGELKHFLENLI